MHIRFIAPLVALLTALGAARAEDQRLAGTKLVLRKSVGAEHLVLVARDEVVAPLPGGLEDPTRVGATLEIENPRTGERARFATAAADWTVNAVGTVFRFRNHLETGPGSEVRALVIRHRRRLKISTRALGITLDEATQRALSVVLVSGTRRYCLLFGGTIGKDRPGRFAARNAPAPIACPAPPTSTTSTSRPPGARPTSTSVTSSTSSTSATTSTSATSVPATLPLGTTTSTSRPPTTSTSRPPTTTTRQPTTTVRLTTTTSTSTSSTAKPPPPPTTTSTEPPPTTTSTAPPPPTTSTSAPPPPTTSTSTTRVTTTSTTTTTDRPCGLRGLQCRGACPEGLSCRGFLACACR